MAVERLAAQQHRLDRGAGAQLRAGAAVRHDQVARGDVDAVQLRLALEDVERALDMAVVEHDLGVRLQVDGDVERVGEYLHRRFLAIGAAGDHPQQGAVALLPGQGGGGEVVEGRIGFLVGLRQGDPGLHAVRLAAGGAFGRRRALGMGDAAAGGHPVDVAGADDLFGAEGVAVVDRAAPQEGDRGQADVRMRAHVQATAGLEHHRAEMVDEHEGADAARLQGGDRASHHETAAEVVHARFDDRGHGGFSVAAMRRRMARKTRAGSPVAGTHPCTGGRFRMAGMARSRAQPSRPGPGAGRAATIALRPSLPHRRLPQ